MSRLNKEDKRKDVWSLETSSVLLVGSMDTLLLSSCLLYHNVLFAWEPIQPLLPLSHSEEKTVLTNTPSNLKPWPSRIFSPSLPSNLFIPKEPFLPLISKTILVWDHQDNSTDKGTCYQARCPEFDPRDTQMVAENQLLTIALCPPPKARAPQSQFRIIC